MDFGGLFVASIELSNICNKRCWMCQRHRDGFFKKDENYGEMDLELVKKIANQLPSGIIVQFHNSGEPLLYSKFKEAIDLFDRQIKAVDTNGKLLVEKASLIIDTLDTITISTFQDDPEWEEQYEQIIEFLKIKGDRKPNVIIRVLGDIGEHRKKLYQNTGCLLVNRVLHSSAGSFEYKKTPCIPEWGFCQELISHLVIDVDGWVSLCIRYDKDGDLRIGNANTQSLIDIWNSDKRKYYIQEHIKGNRNLPICSKCEYYGIPRGD